MPLLDQFESNVPDPIVAPAVEINISSGSDEGGFGGLVDAAADLLGVSGGAAWSEFLVELTISQGLAPRVDVVELLMAREEGAPEAAIGDEGDISFGAPGDLEAVFSGRVIGVERRGDRLRRYRLASDSHTLATTRINQAVTAMSVADAIGFAAGEAGLAVQADLAGSDGVMPQYAFNDSRSLWEHMAYLAGLRGASLWFDADNTLRLGDQLGDGDPVATLSHAHNLLEVNLWERTPHTGEVTAFGGGVGGDGFVLTKEASPNRATSGEGPPQRFYRDGPLQAQEDIAARAAAASLAGSWRASAGELLVTGSAVLGPGSVVEVEGLPDGDDGRYLVLGAQHRFDRRTGWRTRVEVATAESGGGGLAGLLGGLL